MPSVKGDAGDSRFSTWRPCGKPVKVQGKWNCWRLDKTSVLNYADDLITLRNSPLPELLSGESTKKKKKS